MRFRIPQIDMFRWQVFFALWPRRIDQETVVWLEPAARRAILIPTARSLFQQRVHWDYGPVGYVLSQPGVAVDAKYSSAAAQSLNTSGCVSSAQAGGPPLSSRLGSIVGQSGTHFPARGPNYAGHPPSGGLDKASP